MADPITLKDQHGQLFDYDTPEDAQAAVQNLGYAPASAEEIQTYDAAKKEREDFGSTTQQALALGELGVSSATFGILQSNSPEAEARRRQLRKQSPFLAGGAEVAGALVPGLGAAGVLGKAAKLGRAAALGADVASDFASGLSIESEQAQEDHRRIDVGNVALWSLGGVMAENLLRAGFSGVKNFKNNILPSAKTKAQAFRAGGAALEEAGNTAESAARRANTPLSDAQVKETVENWDEIVNNVRTVGHDSGNSFLESFDAAHSISQKADDVRGIMPPPERRYQNAQTKFLEDHVERADRLADVLDERGSPKAASAIRRHVAELQSAADAADLFIAGDQLKRTVDKFSKKASVAARASGMDAFGELAAEFDAVGNPLRKDLEKSKIWGQAAAKKQLEENALWSGKNGFIHNNSIFQDAFYTRLPGGAGTSFDGLPQFAWDDGKFVSFLQKDRIGQKQVLDAGHNTLDSAEKMLKVKEELGIRPADLVQLKTDVSDLRATLNKVADLAKANNQGADLIARLKAKAGKSPTQAVLEGTVGRVPVVGKEVARQMDDFFNPATVKNLDPLVTRDVARANLSGRVDALGKASMPAADQVTASGVPRLQSVLPDAARKTAELTGAAAVHQMNSDDLAELSEHGRAYTDRVASTLASGGQRPKRLADAPTRFQGNFKTLTDAYNARRELLTQIAQDPTVLMHHLADSFGDLPDTHPGMFSQIAARVMAGVTYLTQNLPPGVGYSLRDPAGLPTSQDAMREFARTWDAVFEPADTLHDVATGRATPKQLRALQAVHPDLFAQFQGKVIQKMSARLKPPPYESQRYLDQVMQLDGAYSPALGSKVARNVKNSMSTAPHADHFKQAPLVTSPSNPRGIASISSGPTSGA
jgi:hypothetical protein